MQGIIVDRSSNNAGPVNWAQAKAAGVIAVMLKATDGQHYVNPHYASELAGALAAGIPVLAYHFAEFTDAVAEARHFLSVAGARARILDSETSKDEAWQNAFLVALNEPADELLDYGSASTLPRSGIRAMLWPASYGKAPGFGDVWQFTDKQSVPGMPGLVDASEWIGPDADFDALFNLAPPHPTSGGTMLAPTPTGDGYWTCDSSGAVETFGDAQYLGGGNTSFVDGKWEGPPVIPHGQTVVSFREHPTKQGYWMETSGGLIYSFGAAAYHGAPGA